ncbi:hypothetical protein [Clostridium tagluense]|uniref:Uncharacterized protein n=1 Tax=Clostridium tagluense TaxID=360422 RepID=A0A401UQA4_9CLOT|nr:hypothetical protein [Clostridium tagluense]GCD11700.1 hypothetical protein Ctaglu_33230 [Clostridium tagluense]
MIGKELSYEEVNQLAEGTKVWHYNKQVPIGNLRKVLLTYKGFKRVLKNDYNDNCFILEGLEDYTNCNCHTYEVIEEVGTTKELSNKTDKTTGMKGKLLSFEELNQLENGTKVWHTNDMTEGEVREIKFNYNGYAKVLKSNKNWFCSITTLAEYNKINGNTYKILGKTEQCTNKNDKTEETVNMRGKLLTVRESEVLGMKVLLVYKEYEVIATVGFGKYYSCEGDKCGYEKKYSFRFKESAPSGTTWDNIETNAFVYELLEDTKVEEAKETTQIKGIHKSKAQKKIDVLKGKIVELEEIDRNRNAKEDIGFYILNQTEEANGTKLLDINEATLKVHVKKEHEFMIKYRREGYKIICEFYLNNKCNGIKGIGIARCLEEDSLNYREGICLAELRARSDFYAKVAKNLAESL